MSSVFHRTNWGYKYLKKNKMLVISLDYITSLCWCITASLNYKSTMINRITMETVAYLRSKCHLKQNLIPSWPWSFRHTDFLKFVGPLDRAGRKSQGPAILPSMPVRVSDKIFCFCILFCTGNRKCNWYAGTIMVNSELDSASNDIYFLNKVCTCFFVFFKFGLYRIPFIQGSV
jgi:hypothetical protein